MSSTEVVKSDDSDYVGGRIMEIIDHFGLNKNSFSMKVGLTSNAYIVRIVNDKDAGMSLVLLKKILRAFPTISPDWFILGEGEMFRPDAKYTKGHYIKYHCEPDSSEPVDCLKLVGFDECDVAFNVVGSGMSPKYRSGDIIICKTMTPDEKVLFGEAYLIVSGGTFSIRYIKSMQENKYKLGAEDSRYEDSTIEKSDIQSLYLIKGLIRKEMF